MKDERLNSFDTEGAAGDRTSFVIAGTPAYPDRKSTKRREQSFILYAQ